MPLQRFAGRRCTVVALSRGRCAVHTLRDRDMWEMDGSKEMKCWRGVRGWRHAFDLWAYVFMPDHVHLVIYPRCDDYSISRILLSIRQPVARKAIAYLKVHHPEGLRAMATGQRARPYHFWQKGGGYDRNITQVDTLISTV